MPLLGNNLGANGSKLRWYSIKMLNRIPQVELERKLNDIGRLYAAIKRESRIEEGQLWDFLFTNYQQLATSIARFPEEDIVAGSVELIKPRGEREDPPPYSEVYRQFIIYKAQASVKMFGADKVPRRPKYRDLYRQMHAPKRNNTRNVTALLHKFNAQFEQNEKILAALKAPSIDISDFDDVDGSQSRRHSIRSRRKMTNGDIMASLAHQEHVVTASRKSEDVMTAPRKSEDFVTAPRKPADVVTAPRKPADVMAAPRKPEHVVAENGHTNQNARETECAENVKVRGKDWNATGEGEEVVIQAVKVPVESKPFLPPIFLTVPARGMESEARPPLIDPDARTEKRRKSQHRLKLPKVDE